MTPLDSAQAGSEALRSFAVGEYTRRHEKATLAVAERTVPRTRAERSCRAWLSLVLRLGGSHPHAQGLIDDYAQAAPEWPASAHRAMAANELCAAADLIRHLEHAAAQAFAVALGHDVTLNPAQAEPVEVQPAWARFTQLRQLATRMGSTAPVKLPPVTPVQAGNPLPLEKAA